jgi:hypothetical protein
MHKPGWTCGRWRGRRKRGWCEEGEGGPSCARLLFVLGPMFFLLFVVSLLLLCLPLVHPAAQPHSGPAIDWRWGGRRRAPVVTRT